MHPSPTRHPLHPSLPLSSVRTSDVVGRVDEVDEVVEAPGDRRRDPKNTSSTYHAKANPNFTKLIDLETSGEFLLSGVH